VLGLALLAIAGGAVASLPVAGALTARYGSRPTSRAAALLFCAVLPLPLLAPSLPLLVAAFVLLGIGIGALDVSMNAHAVLVEERYGRPIMSSFHGLFSLGGLIGAALASGAMQVGLPPTPHLVIAAAMLAAAVLAAWPLLLPTAPAPAGGPLFVLPRGRLAVLGAVALIAFMAEGPMGDWSAIYIRMDLGASPVTAAWGFVAFSLTMAIGRFSGDPPGDALQPGRDFGRRCRDRRCHTRGGAACLPSGRGRARLRRHGDRTRQCRAHRVQRGWPAARAPAGHRHRRALDCRLLRLPRGAAADRPGRRGE
jgi:MFS family permease